MTIFCDIIQVLTLEDRTFPSVEEREEDEDGLKKGRVSGPLNGYVMSTPQKLPMQ